MLKIKFFYLPLIISLSFLHLLFAFDDKDTKAWTVDDVLNQESAGSFDISPCGKWVVWVKSRPDKKLNKKVGDIYLASLVDNTEVQLTRGKFNDRSPQWSPDGKKIAFLSSREKEKGTQIWLMNSLGGEPWALTDLKNGINSFDWRTEKNIIFSARENPTSYELGLKKKKDDAIVVGDQEHFWPVRLFQMNVKSKKIKRLTHNSGKISEFVLSPCGKWVVTNEDQDIHYQYDHKIPPRQYLYNLEQKTRKEVFPGKNMRPFNYVWELDGSGFYCAQPLATDPNENYVSVRTLYYFDIKSKKYQQVPLNWKWQLGFFGYAMTKDGILVSLANGAKNKLAFYKKVGDDWKRTFLVNKQSENTFINSVNKRGDLVIFTYSTASTPLQIKAGKIDGNKIINEKEIIKLNKHLKKKHIAHSEVINWKGAKNDKVDGILYYPHKYEPGKTYPLMCVIHGGPAGADIDRFSEKWSNYPNLLASKGCFVLKVNYHGSGNYGLKWIESIKKHYYEYEVPDILKGVDFLINKGLIDPDKLGIMGWSNGAILSIACVINTDRFKVCASGAGDVNWISDYGNCAFGAAFDNAYFGGPPWKRLKHYIEKSPLFKMEKVTTPTIIFFGTNDASVPTEQGWEHYRALQQIGKTPVRFLLFPGEPHGFRKISHQRRKMEEELAWFDKYLFETYKKPNEAFKKDSPLALEFKKRKISKVVGYYGIQEKGLLIPEVVQVNDSLTIGRFEVTRAQYMVFNHNIVYPYGTDNFPINDVSFEGAKKYCRWLSNVTGKNYDLPTIEEKKIMFSKNKSNKKNENTLAYWAGYSPNPDEAAELDVKIAELELSGLLLMEVGCRKPVSDELLIFDISGNVAEWAIGHDGEGIIVGASAVTSTDSKGEYKAPRSEYVGFRVVLRE
jgi:dipeptidyl aminopeptidase/acylaminoacyl peptidase